MREIVLRRSLLKAENQVCDYRFLITEYISWRCE